MKSRMSIWIVPVIVLLTGCVTESRVNRRTIDDRVKAYSGTGIGERKEAGHFDLPPGINVDDGITEDDAVAIALWNNAQFRADLATMAIAEADVVDAGTIPNPVLRYLSPNAGIVAQGYLNVAIDFLWQRPARIEAAQQEAERTAATLVRRSYTLIRDVQVAYTDLLLARKRARLLTENLSLRTQLAEIADSRLRHGDISDLEATVSRTDSAVAADDFQRAVLDTLVLGNRLATLLGFPTVDTTLRLDMREAGDSLPLLPKDRYLELAWTYQPELMAARAAIEAAGARIGWEKSKIASLTAVLNYQHVNGTAGNAWLPNAVNPGIQLELPILNRNQGKIMRAEAELDQAMLQYVALRQRIALDVAEAYTRYEQIWKSYRIWNTDMLPSLEQAVKLVQESYRRGDISYLPVLEAMRQLTNGKLRKAEIEADLRRSVSQLNYSIGKNISGQ